MKIVVKPFAILASAATLLGVTIVTGEQPTPAGVFTTEQAAAGRVAYQARCAACHLPDMSGRNEASPLAGPNFLNVWRDQNDGRIVRVHLDDDAARGRNAWR